MSEEELENGAKKRSHLSKKWILRLAILFLLAAGIAVVVFAGYHMYRVSLGTYTNYEVVSSLEKSGSSASYQVYNGTIMKYSRDGAEAYTQSLDLLWNGSYEMKNPVMDQCGAYVAIGDRGSTLVHIFNGSGAVGSITVDYPILKVQVANQGVVAVLMEQDDVYYIDYYDQSGNLLAEQRLKADGSGYPIDFTLSNDGTKVVVSCIDVSTGVVKMNIGYYNLGVVGDNYDCNQVAGESYEGQMIAKVDFLTNNIVCLYTDTGYILKEMAEKPTETPIAEVSFDQAVESIFSSSDYVGFVLEGAEGEDKYQVVVYDLKGNKVLKKGINFEYSKITMSGTQMIFYTYSQCMVMTIKGRVHFEATFEKSIDSMFAAGNNEYYLICSDGIDLIRLKEGK